MWTASRVLGPLEKSQFFALSVPYMSAILIALLDKVSGTGAHLKLSLSGRYESVGVEEFAAQRFVEPLVVFVLPVRSCIDL